MLGSSVLQDLQVETLADSFNTRTDAGRAALIERLSNPTADSSVIADRQKQLTQIKSVVRGDHRQHVFELLNTLKTTEAPVRSIIHAGNDERHKEWYTQILWSASGKFAFLNTFGWLTELVVAVRTVVLPGIAAMLPIFVFATPIVAAILQGQSVSLKSYVQVLSDAIKRALPPVMGKPRFAGKGGPLEIGEQFIHIGVSLAMFVASIWSQISSAIKMRTVVADMRQRAVALRSYSQSLQELALLLGVSLPDGLRLVWDTNDLGAFGEGWNVGSALEKLLHMGGQLDMFVAVARRGFTCIPKTEHHEMRLTDLWHPGLGDKRVYNSIRLGGGGASEHAILTGPNRGGKSTVLKSLGAAVLMHQTLGIVFARQAILPIFGSIQTALHPADTLGKMSLFEAEIDFAREIRDLKHEGPLFLMMDEIFHGTNAHEGTEASRVFLDWLYAEPVGSIFSVISTHYLDLPRQYTQVQRFCMEAYQTDAGLRYTYRLHPGINELSSVREILRERGLLR